MSGSLSLLQWASAVTGLLFMFALGAIVGSFINVVVYRLPRNINLITPPSRCPSCGTRLRWTQNFPIFGWIFLRGRCRFCRSPISPEYPLVELAVAMLFASLHALWFMNPSPLEIIGADASALRPDWAAEGMSLMWPMYALMLLMIGSLVAMTLIDARTFLIPVAIPWMLAAAALVAHPAHALWLQLARGGLQRSPHTWTIPTPQIDWLAAALGAGAGLVISLLLLRFGLLRRSFADYDDWEAKTLATRNEAAVASEADKGPFDEMRPGELGSAVSRALLLTGPAVALMFLGFSLGLRIDRPIHGMVIGMALGLLIGLPLRHIAASRDGGEGGAGGSQDPIWSEYPHVRREMVIESLFVGPVLLLGVIGWWVGTRLGAPWVVDPLTGAVVAQGAAAPLWLSAFGGALLGAMVGGGVVWAVRIVGSLAFGKEAMGMGDVHLMFGVGACLGWIDPTLAFFIAPFFGIAWAIMSLMLANIFKREGAALPYGPHLAFATLLIVYARPVFEWALSMLMRQPIDLP